MEFTTHKNGTFCWADLATTDTDGAKDFYKKLLNWEHLDLPTEGMVYTMLNLHGKAAAALYAMMPEHKAMNIPPHWMSYIACDDLKLVMEKIIENGGKILMEPWEVPDFGIGVMFQDPEGAVVGLWQAKEHIGTHWKNIHGSVCWFEYASHGSNATIPFYENVFGYKANTQLMGETSYTTFIMGEEPIAGLYILPEEMKDIPCHWLVYFTVDSIEKAIEITEAEKGQVLMPKLQIPNMGYFSVIRDPQGAVLGLFEQSM